VARQLLLFDPPERFVAGTVGQPGERQFYLQAREGRRLVSVALEKQQVQALADRVETMLDTIMRRSGGEAAIPAAAPLGSEDLDPLDTPIVEEFRVGAMASGWNPTPSCCHRGARDRRGRGHRARPRGGPRRRSDLSCACA
jgi:uncharacterized repeat protein (TIGR03847 family)